MHKFGNKLCTQNLSASIGNGGGRRHISHRLAFSKPWHHSCTLERVFKAMLNSGGQVHGNWPFLCTTIRLSVLSYIWVVLLQPMSVACLRLIREEMFGKRSRTHNAKKSRSLVKYLEHKEWYWGTQGIHISLLGSTLKSRFWGIAHMLDRSARQ